MKKKMRVDGSVTGLYSRVVVDRMAAFGGHGCQKLNERAYKPWPGSQRRESIKTRTWGLVALSLHDAKPRGPRGSRPVLPGYCISSLYCLQQMDRSLPWTWHGILKPDGVNL